MQKKGKVLGIDFGKKRVGIASGDLEMKIAFPREVIENKDIESLLNTISSFCEELEVKIIVVGLPLNMDKVEEDNEMVQEVRYFVKKMRETFLDVDIRFFDERLSSFEAKHLIEDAKQQAGKQKLGKDAYAAQVILQRFFDKL